MYTKEFAKIYDELGWKEFSEKLYPEIKKHIAPKGTVLDIACGTGTLADYFAKDGYTVTAFDASSAMITEAKKKNKKVHFFVDTMQAFSVPTKFDLIVCMYDSINHITDWKYFFKKVHTHLTDRGVFVFDFNTPKGLKNWNRLFVSEHDKGICIFSGNYNENNKSAVLSVRCFVDDTPSSSPKKKYTLVEDVFTSYTYPFVEVKKWLKEAGFSHTHLCEPPTKNSQKIILVCKKNVPVLSQ